jgi:chemotaxis protein MotA
MVVIVGFIVVIGCVLGGFTWAGGHIHSLIHPSEILTIGGASIGAMIVMSPTKVLKELVQAVIQCMKGSPYNKKAHAEMFQAMYDLFRFGRRNGLLALEPHLSDPHHSTILNKYPTVIKNHHACTFIAESLLPVVESTAKPEELPGILERQLKAMEEEHHGPISVLTKTADALPGFGIVAAVLGIVITMGHIDGPPEEIGHKVGAALVGTFLGILASYGFFAPLAVKMEFLGHAEMGYYRAIATIIGASADGGSSKTAIDTARRMLPSDVRPTSKELDELFAAVDASG